MIRLRTAIAAAAVVISVTPVPAHAGSLLDCWVVTLSCAEEAADREIAEYARKRREQLYKEAREAEATREARATTDMVNPTRGFDSVKKVPTIIYRFEK